MIIIGIIAFGILVALPIMGLTVAVIEDRENRNRSGTYPNQIRGSIHIAKREE